MGYWPHLLLIGLVALLWLWDRRHPQTVNRLEENILIGLMVLITAVSFGQVIARYMFNTGWSAALEFTTSCFSWLILFGMSYGIKHGTHLGVDVFLNKLPPGAFRWVSMLGGLAGLLYGLLLLD
ncbi:MAG: TRAP transporter small permease, partial [Burkholderiaceae bacterium]